MKASTILTAVASATVAMTFAALPAAAQSVGKNIERRIERQSDRIAQGVRSGELTRYEARQLKAENRHIRRKFDRFCRDSRLDRFERKRLTKLLRVANDNIYAEKHDAERRYARGGRRGHDRHDRVSERFDDAPWYNYRRYTRRWR